jgi:hypothetical protein
MIANKKYIFPTLYNEKRKIFDAKVHEIKETIKVCRY